MIIVLTACESAIVEVYLQHADALTLTGVAQEEATCTLLLVTRTLMHGGLLDSPPQARVEVRPAQQSGPFDLAIVVGLLLLRGQLAPDALANTLVLGNLSLNGLVQPVQKLHEILHCALDHGITKAVIPGCQAAGTSSYSNMTLSPVWRMEDLLFLGPHHVA